VPPLPDSTAADWRLLCRVGAGAAVGVLVLMPLQMVVFIAWPPPDTAVEWLTLFRENAVVGLLDMDLLLTVDYVLLAVVFLALATNLVRRSPSLAVLSLMLELLAISSYFASMTAFEMLTLSRQYADASDGARRTIIEGTAHGLLATWEGTAFNVSYVLSAVALLMVSTVMLRSKVFSRAAGWSGVLAGAMSVVPPTVGSVGMVLSIASLAPTAVWLWLVARGLTRPSAVVIRRALP
jgi:hypothetical protein